MNTPTITDSPERVAAGSSAATCSEADLWWQSREKELADLYLQAAARRFGAHFFGIKDCETYDKRFTDLKRAAIKYAQSVNEGVLPPPNGESSDRESGARSGKDVTD
jgi:hypothetical protein